MTRPHAIVTIASTIQRMSADAPRRCKTPRRAEQGLPMVAVTAADGARFEAYLHGAHVTSWRPAGERRRTPVRERRAKFEPTASRSAAAFRSAFRNSRTRDRCPCTVSCARCRGRCWTRARRRTARRTHAFASTRRPCTRVGRTPFACELDVRAHGPGRRSRSPSTNTGHASFAFTAALHTYLRMTDVRAARRARTVGRALSRQGVEAR